MGERMGYRVVVGILALVLSISLIGMPLVSNVVAANALPQMDTQQACADAEAQAINDISGTTWFLIGCIIGVVGYLVAVAVETNPPASALVGQPPEYVAAYTDCYKRKAKEIKSKNALYGCLAGTGASCLFYLLLAAAAGSAAETTY